jgi:hypothetical protein
MEALTTFRSGFQLSRGLSTKLPVLASLRLFHPSSKYEASPHLLPAASRNSLWASAYRSQRSSTCSTVSLPRLHLHVGLSASFFLKRQEFKPQCSIRACIRMEASSDDSAPFSTCSASRRHLPRSYAGSWPALTSPSAVLSPARAPSWSWRLRVRYRCR